MQEIMVSVLCMAYNHEKYIRKTLESIVNQKTNFPFEVIVHDDASTDNTAAIIREFEEKYPDIIKPIYQSVNQYRNYQSLLTEFCIPKAVGKYCAICECDDFWTSPDKLQKQVDYMESHPECTLCIHNATQVDINDATIGHVETTTEDRIITCEEVIRGGGNYCATNSILAPAKLMKNVPEYFDIITIDYVWQIYLASEGTTYCFGDEMSAYRIGVENSWTSQMTTKKHRKDLCKTYAQINDALSAFDCVTKEKYHDAVVDSQTLRQFEILYMERRFDELKQEPYRSLVKKTKLPLKNRMVYFAGMHFPGILRLIEKIM